MEGYFLFLLLVRTWVGLGVGTDLGKSLQLALCHFVHKTKISGSKSIFCTMDV